MDKTEKLKHIILSKYNSIREFAKIADIPSTTLTSALDKGIGGMAVDRIIKICEVLNIDIRTFESINDSLPNNLSETETTLLENYNKLNNLGKEEANKRVSELTMIPTYIEIKSNVTELIPTNKDDKKAIFIPYKSLDEAGTTIAAHDDDLTDEEKEIADKILLDHINNERLKEFNKKHNIK